MTIIAEHWAWFFTLSGGYHTMDFNMPPQTVVAHAVLYGTDGPGVRLAGIKQYRRRLSNGSEQVVDFGDWGAWRPLINDHVSSVTYAIATGRDQAAWALARIETWEP